MADLEENIRTILENLEKEFGQKIPESYLAFTRKKLNMALGSSFSASLKIEECYLSYKKNVGKKLFTVGLLFYNVKLSNTYYNIGISKYESLFELHFSNQRGHLVNLFLKTDTDKEFTFNVYIVDSDENEMHIYGEADEEKILTFFNANYHEC